MYLALYLMSVQLINRETVVFPAGFLADAGGVYPHQPTYKSGGERV